MNLGIVRYIISWVLKFEAAFLLLPSLTGFIYLEWKDALVYLGVALLCFLVGFTLGIKKPKHRELYTREGFASVALSWTIMSLFGAL
ncbi:MAG: TrkH family potassium uptake protein, partial [Lachnospiraceae bacterium]|nr:TrkH family potassium uptake protein [Lachnospiraceae bacterium]